MSEQLYFTWSEWGYEATTGQRVRAVTRAFTDMQSPRMQALKKFLPYALPQGTDPFTTAPKDAPLCLVFINTGWQSERILLQKKYKGNDGVGRSGKFFSHLLADLPQRQSRNNLEYVSEFLAQDAIELWHSSFWKDSEDHLYPPERLDLPEVSDADLQPGTLTERDMVKVQAFLPFVIQAFMLLKGNQHLYIAAEPDEVAALIWGLTHAFPRTLRVMHTLTFSTFERDIEKTSAVIAGTCWITVSTRGSAASSHHDLPPSCYQNNGLGINCYPYAQQLPLEGRSELSTYTDEAEYALFATQCFTRQQTWKLKQFLTRAEKLNITEIQDFLREYKALKAKLSKETIVDILRSLLAKVRKFLQPYPANTPGGKAQEEQIKIIEMEAEVLKQDNFQTSFIEHVDADRQWWEYPVKGLLQDLQEITDKRQHQAITTILARALLPLSTTLTDKTYDKIQSDETTESLFWYGVLFHSVNNFNAEKVWTYLLERLVDTPDTAAHQEWWNHKGRGLVSKMRQFANRNPDTRLTSALIAYANSAVTAIEEAIFKNQETSSFWGEVLATCAPVANVPHMWGKLVRDLADTPYTITYQRWWKHYGKDAVNTLRAADSDPQLASDLTSFTEKALERLLVAIAANSEGIVTFCADVFEACAPPASMSDTWTHLLQRFNTSAMQTRAFQLWWRLQGQSALRALRTSIDMWPNKQLVAALTFFAGRTLDEFKRIIEPVDTAIQTSQAAPVEVSEVDFWNDVMLTLAPPTNEPEIWIDLLKSLTTSRICTPAYQKWWTTFQGEQTVGWLRAALDKHPQQKLMVEFRQEIITRIVRSFVESIRQRINGIAIVTWGSILVQVAPPDKEPGRWLDLLQELTDSKPTPDICTNYPWELRSWLLSIWGKKAIIGLILKTNNVPVLRKWLTVYWSEFEQLLSLELPEEWFILAITDMLKTIPFTPSATGAINRTNVANPGTAQQVRRGEIAYIHPAYDCSPQTIMGIVTRHSPLFEMVLEDLILRDDEAERSAAICFFALLAEDGYQQKLPLLIKMLAKLYNEKEARIMQLLLAAAKLDKQERATVLELYFMAQAPGSMLPASYIELLNLYLQEFTVSDLSEPRTRGMLQQLQRLLEAKRLLLPEEQRARVRLWCKIAESLDEPAISQLWLRDLRAVIGGALLLSSDVRSELTVLFLEKLVYFASSESKLTRVIDYLGPVLMEDGVARHAPELRLFELMAEKAGALFATNESSSRRIIFGRIIPGRIIPYITLALQEAELLDSIEKGEFIANCLNNLLKLDRGAILVIQSYTDSWPDQVQDAWKKYVRGSNPRFRFISKARDEIGRAGKKVEQIFKRGNQDEQGGEVAYDTNDRRDIIVAYVNGQPITQKQLEHITKFRRPYLEYRIVLLNKKIDKRNLNERDKESARIRLVNLQQLLNETQEMQERRALVELEDDLLIRAAIEKILQEKSTPPGELSAQYQQGELERILKEFRENLGDKYTRLEFREEDVVEALRIYARRNLFHNYLYHYTPQSLTDWLRDQRPQANIQY